MHIEAPIKSMTQNDKLECENQWLTNELELFKNENGILNREVLRLKDDYIKLQASMIVLLKQNVESQTRSIERLKRRKHKSLQWKERREKRDAELKQ